MAIKFQYNKTSLQQLEKQLKMRERSLPTIKSKESALRIEVKRTKDEVRALELQLEQKIQSYDMMMALWNEFRPELIQVKDVTLSSKKIAGVMDPLLEDIQFDMGYYGSGLVHRWYRVVEATGTYRYRGRVLKHETGVIGACPEKDNTKGEPV